MSFDIEDVTVWGVYDAGVPNMERVVLRVHKAVHMSAYALIVGLRANDGGSIPLRDNFFWFGNALLKPGDWVYVYTAPGESKVMTLPNTSDELHSVHWGKTQTVFQNPHLMPVLIRLDGIQYPEHLPQLAHGQTAGS